MRQRKSEEELRLKRPRVRHRAGSEARVGSQRAARSKLWHVSVPFQAPFGCLETARFACGRLLREPPLMRTQKLLAYTGRRQSHATELDGKARETLWARPIEQTLNDQRVDERRGNG